MGYDLPEDHHGPTPGDLKSKLEEAGSKEKAAEIMRDAYAKKEPSAQPFPTSKAPRMVNEPSVIDLSEDEKRELQKFHDQQIATQQFISTVQQQGEERLAQLQQRGRELWQKLDTKYDLDLKHVDYSLSDDGDRLIPVRMKIGD